MCHTAVLVLAIRAPLFFFFSVGLFLKRFVENFRGTLVFAEEVKTLEWGRPGLY